MQYTADNLIGEGGFSKIYRVVIAGQTYALKRIKRSNNGFNSVLEPHINLYISHPHLISAVTVTIDRLDQFQIVQPLASSNAFQVIRDHRLSPSLYEAWSSQLITAVGCLHSHGIIHGDIKASNVLVFGSLDQSIVKLADFSFSVFVPDPDVKIAFTRMVYTPTHRPPEVWREHPWTYSADIWALGCTLYQLKHKRCLFRGESLDPKYQESLIHKHLKNSELRPLLNLNPDQRPTIWDLLKTEPKFPRMVHPIIEEFTMYPPSVGMVASLLKLRDPGRPHNVYVCTANKMLYQHSDVLSEDETNLYTGLNFRLL